jgi:hypothetical protein
MSAIVCHNSLSPKHLFLIPLVVSAMVSDANIENRLSHRIVPTHMPDYIEEFYGRYRKIFCLVNITC